jgi:hypothetical protein
MQRSKAPKSTGLRSWLGVENQSQFGDAGLMKSDELSRVLSQFSSNDHIRQLNAIIASSTRFQAFAWTNLKRICKKIRGAVKNKVNPDEQLSDVALKLSAQTSFYGSILFLT